jgi:putative copper export protein
MCVISVLHVHVPKAEQRSLRCTVTLTKRGRAWYSFLQSVLMGHVMAVTSTSCGPVHLPVLYAQNVITGKHKIGHAVLF